MLEGQQKTQIIRETKRMSPAKSTSPTEVHYNENQPEEFKNYKHDPRI